MAVPTFLNFLRTLRTSAYLRSVLATAAAQINSISLGMTQGFSAVLLPQLLADDSSIWVSQEEASWIAGLGVIANPVGALLAGVLMEVLGRRATVILTSLPYAIGWFLIGLADDVSLIYMGRVIGGLAAGMNTSSFLYVAEASPKQHRGMLSGFASIFVSFGVLAIYTLGFFFPWREVAISAILFASLGFLAMSLVPESPVWYVSRNQPDKALESLKWLRQSQKQAELELSCLLEARTECKESKRAPVKEFLGVMCSPTVYKPFLLLLAFFIFQQGSGIYILLFYAVQVFKQFGTHYDENLVSVTVGVVRLVTSILGAYLMSRFGRRPLGVVSGVGMGLTMLIICIYDATGSDATLQFLPLLCVLLNVGFSMVGFLQLPWLLPSELFPPSHRGFLGGVVSSIGYLFLFFFVKLYPTLLNVVGIEGLVWLFTTMSCLGAVFIYFCLPETKDKSLEDVSRSFLRQETSNSTKEKYVSTIDFVSVIKDRSLDRTDIQVSCHQN